MDKAVPSLGANSDTSLYLAYQPAPAGKAVRYERRRPEETVLYQLVQEHLETFLAQVDPSTGQALAAGHSTHSIRHGCRPHPSFDQAQDRLAPSRGPLGGYRSRRPEKTVVYQVVQQNLETWLTRVREAEPDSDPVPRFVERDLRKYLDIDTWRAEKPACKMLNAIDPGCRAWVIDQRV